MHDRPDWLRPEHPEEQRRWKHLDKVQRVLEGRHKDDVKQEVREMFAGEIAEELNIAPDVSSNVLKSVARQRAINYDRPPRVEYADDSAETGEGIAAVVTPRLWPLRSTGEFYLVGMQECLMALDWPSQEQLDRGVRPQVQYRLVLPNFVECWAHPDDPTQPGKVCEYRPRKVGGEMVWTRETWDWRSADEPVFRIDKVAQGSDPVDLTEQITGATGYPYLDNDGRPIPRYVLSHMRVGNHLWNWRESTEGLAATLRAAALWTHWGDGFVNAANPQRYVVNLDAVGGDSRNFQGKPTQAIRADRKAIIKFKGQGQPGTFPPAMDPKSGIDAIQTYEQRAAVSMDLSPADFEVTSGQSGYAIVMSREGLRRAQLRVRPALELSDRLLVAYGARLANAHLSPSPGLPEDPDEYSVVYHDLPRSAAEVKAEAEARALRVDAGMMSRIDAIREERPDMTYAEAVARAAEIVRDEQVVDAIRQALEAPADVAAQAIEDAGAAVTTATEPPPRVEPAEAATEDEDDTDPDTSPGDEDME